MKKHLTTLLLALMLAAVAAAQGGKIRIEGTIDSKKWDGKRVILFSYGTTIESNKIKQGKFIIEDSVYQPQLSNFDVHGDNDPQVFYSSYLGPRFSDSPIIGNDILILEPGTIHMNFHDVNGKLECTTISGTPLNDRLQDYYNQNLADIPSPDDPLRRMVDIRSGQVEPNSIEEVWATEKPITYYYAKLLMNKTNRLWDLYHANEHNPLGLYAIHELLGMDHNWARKDFADSILRTTDPWVAQTIRYRLDNHAPYFYPSDRMLDFKGNAIRKIEGSNNWSEPSPTSFKQLHAKHMSIIYFWGYDINNNVRDELVQLRSLLDSIGAKDINFIGVYSSEYELHKLPERLNSTGIDFPVFIDTDHQIATLYNSREHHHGFLLVDPDGIILVSTLHSFFDNDTKRNLRAFLQ